MRLKPEQHSVFYRPEPEINTCCLVTGVHARVNTVNEISLVENEDNLVLRNPLDIFQTILETLKKSSSMLIEEDVASWTASGCKKNMGKCLLVDQSDYQTQHIFFDDCVEEGDESALECRDIVTGKEIGFDKCINMYMVKVHPTRAILEMDYFIKMIEVCETKRDEEIQRIEAGIEDDDAETELAGKSILGEGETEWEKIQKLPDADYLMRCVLPVLY